MTAEPFLQSIEDLFGDQPTGGVTMAAAVRTLTSPPPPAGWESVAAEGLQEHRHRLDTNTGSFADRDDDLKARLDAAAQAVAAGKARVRQIRADYQKNSARLTSNSPETAALRAELDRSHIQAAVDTVRDTQSRLPTLTTYQAGGAKEAPSTTGGAVPVDSETWKPGDKRHRPYLAGPGELGPPNTWGGPPWVDLYDRTQDPDKVPHYFVRSDEIPGYKTYPPGALGPPTVYDEHGNPDPYIPLGPPNSGVWVPKSDFPGAIFQSPDSNERLPYGYEQYLPGIYMWHGDLNE